MRCERLTNRPLRSLALPLTLAIGALALLGGCVGKPGPVGNLSVPQPAKAVALDAYLGK